MGSFESGGLLPAARQQSGSTALQLAAEPQLTLVLAPRPTPSPPQALDIFECLVKRERKKRDLVVRLLAFYSRAVRC